MSLERLRFLEAALKEAMALYEDPNDVVKEAVRKIKEEGVSGRSHVLCVAIGPF